MAINEISIDDAELDALMAELEEQTADMVVQPIVATTPSASVEIESPSNAEPPVPWEEPKESAPTEVAGVKTSEDEDLERMLGEIDANASVTPDVKAEAAPVPIEEVKKPAKLKAVKTTPPIVAPETTASGPISASRLDNDDLSELSSVKKASLRHGIDADRFGSEMRLTETNLDESMMSQASLRAYYGAEAARAEAQYNRLKMTFEIKEAAMYDKYRKVFLSAGEKVTEKMVENAVKLDPAWLAAMNVVIEAQSIANTIKQSCVAALNDRRDMLIQLGADRREEGKGAARILASQNAHADARQRAMDAARTGS